MVSHREFYCHRKCNNAVVCPGLNQDVPAAEPAAWRTHRNRARPAVRHCSSQGLSSAGCICGIQCRVFVFPCFPSPPVSCTVFAVVFNIGSTGCVCACMHACIHACVYFPLCLCLICVCLSVAVFVTQKCFMFVGWSVCWIIGFWFVWSWRCFLLLFVLFSWGRAGGGGGGRGCLLIGNRLTKSLFYHPFFLLIAVLLIHTYKYSGIILRPNGSNGLLKVQISCHRNLS